MLNRHWGIFLGISLIVLLQNVFAQGGGLPPQAFAMEQSDRGMIILHKEPGSYFAFELLGDTVNRLPGEALVCIVDGQMVQIFALPADQFLPLGGAADPEEVLGKYQEVAQENMQKRFGKTQFKKEFVTTNTREKFLFWHFKPPANMPGAAQGMTQQYFGVYLYKKFFLVLVSASIEEPDHDAKKKFFHDIFCTFVKGDDYATLLKEVRGRDLETVQKLINEKMLTPEEKEKKEFEEKLEENPDDVQLNYDYAKFLIDEFDDIDTAFKHFEKAIAGNPEKPEIYRDYGFLLANEKEEIEKARELYKKALAINEKETRTLIYVALSFQQEGDKKKAQKYYKKALKSDKKSGEANYYYAEFLKNVLNKERSAKKYYKKAEKLGY